MRHLQTSGATKAVAPMSVAYTLPYWVVVGASPCRHGEVRATCTALGDIIAGSILKSGVCRRGRGGLVSLYAIYALGTTVLNK